MNLEAAIAQHEAKKVIEDNERKVLLIAPSTETLPDDGILKYVTANTVYDFASIPDRSVVLIDRTCLDMLRAVVDYQTLFGVTLRVLTGLPAADYSIEFDQVVWSLDKVAYAPLVSELALEIEVENQTKAANMSIHDKERSQFTRADGTVKKQSNFDVASENGDETDDGGDGE